MTLCLWKIRFFFFSDLGGVGFLKSHPKRIQRPGTHPTTWKTLAENSNNNNKGPPVDVSNYLETRTGVSLVGVHFFTSNSGPKPLGGLASDCLFFSTKVSEILKIIDWVKSEILFKTLLDLCIWCFF